MAQLYSGTALGDASEVAAAMDPVAALRSARAADAPLPSVSRCCGVQTLERAYQIQQATRTGSPAGFKAGLTSEETRQRFKTDTPVSGVLYVSGNLPKGETINLDRFHTPMLETEVVFVVGKPITEPPADVASLRPLLANVVPALEIPDLHFTDPASLSAIDIAAANVGSCAYLLGPEKPLSSVNLEGGYARLLQNGQIIGRGKMQDVMGGALEAALWLVRHRLSLGDTLQPGDLLFTGAIGGMHPMKEGEYLAEFGELGAIPFRVRPLGAGK